MSAQTNMNEVLDSLKISAECVGFGAHRHLAHFDLSLLSGTPISKIERSVREIALGIRSKSVPIVKPIPDQGVVRLQVAMKDIDPIYLKDILSDDDFYEDQMCPIILGEDEDGQKVVMDMADNPHLLVAGSTGSGKSILLHTIIGGANYLKNIGFRGIAFFLFDTKRVEFDKYMYLKDTWVFNTYESTVKEFELLVKWMNERYESFAKKGIRNISESPLGRAFVFIIVDELADLLLQDKDKRLQSLIVNIAQKGRAAGYYLVLATQRPSVDVLSGVIKANCPARIACKTASRKDSEVILDCVGADRLMGKGDAILRNAKHNNVRLQIAYTTDTDVLEMFPKFDKRKIN